MAFIRTPMTIKVDAYQAGHFKLIPKGMENFQCSQVIHRKRLYQDDARLVAAGLGMFIKDHIEPLITQDDIKEAEEFYKDFHAPGMPYPWPKEMFQTVVDKYNGKLPLVITGLKDGQTFYTGEPQVQVWTDATGMGELVGWIESTLLPYIWASTIVATRGRKIRQKIALIFKSVYPEKTLNECLAMSQYQFHDFGRRGAANSRLTGVAHLINWLGTDTVDSAWFATKYLNGGKKFGACSIMASAHRTTTPWDKEEDAYKHHIEQFAGQFSSLVTDSYNDEKALDMVGQYAKLIKEKGGYLVVRPDSGDPVEKILLHLNKMDQYFGHTEINGFKRLNNSGVIQGDGIDEDIVFEKIYPALLQNKWAPDNLALGMGQGNHLASIGMIETAYKTCLVKIDDNYKPVMKISNTSLKTSLPCPVGINTDKRFGIRIDQISPDELTNNEIGSYHVYYDYRKDSSINIPLFEETRKLALDTWDNHTNNPDNFISDRIKDLQNVYKECYTGK